MIFTRKGPRYLLNLFTSGSLIVLLMCLCATALIFSATFIKREHGRAAISLEQISTFFGYQYSSFAEEMWTASYDAIDMRIAEFAKQFGHASYEFMLVDTKGQCVYDGKLHQPSITCGLPQPFKAQISKISSTSNHQSTLFFDKETNRYVYMAPLYVGSVLRGFIYATLSDPYSYYRGTIFTLAANIFLPVILCLVCIWYLWVIISKRFILRPYLAYLINMEKKQALADLAAQVAHDYQSPLAGLKTVIQKIKGIPTQQRLLLNSSISRIESLSNDLLIRYSHRNENYFTFVSVVIDEILAEKIATLGENTQTEFQCNLSPAALVSGVAISHSELSRVLSNIFNNAIEATKLTSNGLIHVTTDIKDNDVYINIEDNGKGMPPEILHKVRTIGGTYDKAKGSGLGIQHAKSALGRIGGAFCIDSEVGCGTKVSLRIPLESPPAWSAQCIMLAKNDRIIILDDDESIHYLWKEKLAGFNLTFLRDPEEFDIAHYPFDKCRYIFDYDIIGCPITGLDLIRSNHLGERALLVTSYFNEPKIQKAVQETQSKMLAKFMIAKIAVEIIQDKPASNNSFDLVLIDDDPLMHAMWNLQAAEVKKNLLVLTDVTNFDKCNINKETPIYIDKQLGKHLDGFEVAKELSKQGYRNLHITTGYEIPKADKPPYVTSILGKKFPY